MTGSTKMLIVLAVIVSIVCTLPCAAVTWNAKDDLKNNLGQTSGVLINPNGDWSYGWAKNAEPFTNYTFYPHTGFATKRGERPHENPTPMNLSNRHWRVWTASTSTALNVGEDPSIHYSNTTGPVTGDVSFSLTLCTFPADTLMMVSGFKSTTQPSRQKSILRWTAPGSGTYTINATFINRYALEGEALSDGYDTDVHIIKNSSEVLDTGIIGYDAPNGNLIESRAYNQSLTLAAGDTLDFVVGHGTRPLNKNRSGVAGLDLTITSTATFGNVTGTVTTAGGVPIAEATVTAAGGNRSTTTDANGYYELSLLSGANTLTISKPGYLTQTINVTTPSGNNNVALMPSGIITGQVTVGGLGVNRAKISVTGRSEFTYTAEDGTYWLPLPAGTYELTVSKPQFSTMNQTGVVVTDGATTSGVNFAITVNEGASWTTSAGFNRENPNDNWSYGRAPNIPSTGYTFTLNTECFVSRQSSWNAGDVMIAANGGPDSWAGTGAAAWIYDPNGTALHPGANERAVMRFTAPVAGWYTVDAWWFKQATSDTVDWATIVNGSTNLLSGTGFTEDGLKKTPVVHTGVYLPQGGTIDFVAGNGGDNNTMDWAKINAIISYGVSGVTGTVKDSNGNPLEGVTVAVGEEPTVTDADGKYMLPTSVTGSVTVTISKPTYETVTQNVTINPGELTTVNATLVDSGYFTGKVLANPAPGLPIACATLKSLDGAYSMTTGDDGSFSARVSSGTHEFRVYKYGYVARIVEITVAPEGLDQDIMMTKGWDMAGDFTSTANPNGVWTFAWDTETSSTVTAMHMNAVRNSFPEANKGWSYHGSSQSTPSVHTGIWLHNGNPYHWTKTTSDNLRANVERFSVVTHPSGAFEQIQNIKRMIAQFRAPSDGYYDVKVRWTGRTDNDYDYLNYDKHSVNGTTSKIYLRKNGNDVTLEADQLDGYVGTISHGYTDSFGTRPEVNHSETSTLASGDLFEVIVGGNNCGWTGVDFRVSAAEDAAYVLGRVTASVPGNPALAGATVTIAGPKTYEVTTDADGYYLVPVEPGSYTVTAFIDGYTSGNLNTGALVSGGSATLNFSLTASGLAYINGKVTTGGAPLAGATVTVVGAQTYTVTTDANGDYVVLVAPGSYTVTASAEGYQSYTVTADNLTAGNGATRNLSIWLIEDSAHLSGTVRWTNREGNPVVEAKIVAEGGYPNYQTFETYSDASGHYELVLEPGTEYEIVASRPGTKNKADSFALEVSAGETITHDFGLEFGGVWDAADDYSSVYNPIGEWSYGWTSLSSERAEFGLYTQVTGVIGGEKLNYKFWTTAGGGMWNGGVRKNPNSVMSIFENIYGEYQQTWYSEPNQLVMFPGGQTSQGHDRLSIVRWTAPKNMVVDVYARWSSQWAPGYVSPDNGLHQYPFKPVVAKNGTIISAPILRGFAGRGEANFTDAFGLAGRNPVETFATPIAVNAGDTVDFSFADNNLQQYLIGLEAKIEEYKGQYAMVNSISEIKAQEDGTVVFLLTPMQLACGTYHSSARQEGCFEYQYGTAQPEVSWFIQTDDRTQGIKCIVPAGGLPSLDADNKVTLTGVVDTDEYGEKVILVGSINSYTASAKPAPLGKTLKSLTNTGTLVRVWGRITHLEPNPNPVINPDNGTKDFVYEYITLNDGSNAVKVLLHVQGEMISDFDEWVRNLSVGDYLGVTGIAYTIGNGEVVVMPRTSTDINFYADN